MCRRLIQLGALIFSASVLAAEHWSFQPLQQTPGGSVDEFIHAKLAAQGMKSSPRADARTLIRRATFDLTGLPPSDLSDSSDEAPDATRC